MWRLIDLSGEGYYIHVKNKNVLVEKDGKKVSSVAFSDINSILVHGSCNSFSEEFLSACVEHCIPLILCDDKHLPSGMLLPWYQHSDFASRFNGQLSAKLPKRKQAWQKIVKAKVLNQSELLSRTGFHDESKVLQMMSSHILTGDSTNIEAQAARLYFPKLFGADFLRTDENSLNAHLNYGYTIARSLIARAVVGAGLCPSLSVFHSNRINPFALVDDLVEPIRPFVDEKVMKIMYEDNPDSLLSASKKKLIALLTYEVKIRGQIYELSHAVEKYVLSYYRFIVGEEKGIAYPQFVEDE